MQAARDDYGVVLDPLTMQIDAAATRDARGQQPSAGTA